jgi:uncharacterized protein YxjI
MDSKTCISSPNTPIAILEHPVFRGAQKYVLNQHQNSFTGRDFTFLDSDGGKIFEVDGVVHSKTFRRNFKDAQSEQVLMELNRNMGHMSGAWIAEFPDPRRRTVANVDLKWSLSRVKVDVTFYNSASAQATASAEEKLEIRGQDSCYRETHVLCRGVTVVRVIKTTGKTLPVVPFLNTNRPGRRDTWEVDVADDVDAALALMATLVAIDFVTPMVRTSGSDVH